MILIFLLSLISSLFSVLYLYKNINISNKKVKIIIYFLIVFFSTSSIYLLRSNYWLGENIFKKIKNDISIQDANNIKPGSINKIISFLEEDLKANPKKIETIKKLAEIKYILSDFQGALLLFEKGRKIDKKDIDFLSGEANSRLMIEKDQLNNYTIDLFKKIILQDPDNLIALMVLADYSYNTEKLDLANSYYKKLLSVLDKNSLEYKKIYEKYKSLEKINEN